MQRICCSIWYNKYVTWIDGNVRLKELIKIRLVDSVETNAATTTLTASNRKADVVTPSNFLAFPYTSRSLLIFRRVDVKLRYGYFPLIFTSVYMPKSVSSLLRFFLFFFKKKRLRRVNCKLLELCSTVNPPTLNNFILLNIW